MLNPEILNILNEKDPSNNEYDDIFCFKQMTLPYIQNEYIAAIGVCSKFLIFSNKKNEIFRWIFDDPESTKQCFPLPAVIENVYVSKIFCDNKGNHSIIFLSNAQVKISFYFHLKSQKFKELVKLKDIQIESLAFDEAKSTEYTTGQILIGTENGNIIGYQLDYDIRKDQVTEKSVILINLKGSIYGIGFETLTLKNNDLMRYIVAVTDTHFYQLIGPYQFEQLFKKYKEPKYIENACKIFPPGDILRSQLQLLYVDSQLHSFGWMTGAGFCFGTYSNDPYDILIKNFTIIPYAKLGRVLYFIIKENKNILTTESPKSVAHSEYHIYLLFSDCISIISKITNNIVHTENHKGNIVNMYYDKVKKCIWMHSNKVLYQLTIDHEDRDIWKAHLEKQNFDLALLHCEKNNLPHEKKVARLYAYHFYDNNSFKESALMFARSDEKFEEVTLKFLINQQYVALKIYLEVMENKFSEQDFTQRSLIDTWLVEIYLNEINNSNDLEAFSALSYNLKELLQLKEKYLDKNTVYQLLQHYGRVDEFLFFAEIKKDYETIILHHINEKNIKTSIDRLKYFSEVDSKKSELYNLFTRYSHIFMKYEPEATIDLLLENFKNNIDPNKIITAIMNTEIEKREKVVFYLEKLIKDNCKEKNIHNLYIFFLCQIAENKQDYIERLLGYLEEKSHFNNLESTDFDVDYALKVFSQFKIYQAQTYALYLMGKYDESIKVALEHNYLDIAKKIAKLVKDKKIQKRLWLEIFNNEIVKNPENIKLAIKAMNESEVLKIEDVLPHLMDNIRIEDFKEEIQECIKKYEEDNTDLKIEITKYNLIAENIKTDINKVNKKFLELRYKQCECDVCHNTIKDNIIYVFPCRHMFDANCIINMLQQYSNNIPSLSKKLEKIMTLKHEIEALERRKKRSNIDIDLEKTSTENRGNILQVFQTYFTGKPNQRGSISIAFDELGKLSNNKLEYSELLCEECVLCGDYIVESIKFSFVDNYDKSTWMII